MSTENAPESVSSTQPVTFLPWQSNSDRPSVHFLRHAEGYHNVNRNYHSLENLDARLTPKGLQQCQALAQQIETATEGPLYELKQSNDVLIVSSPLTRTLQTAQACLHPLKQSIVAHDAIRETVNYHCDRRRNRSELQAEFPQVDFKLVQSDEDDVWQHYESWLGADYTHHRESSQLSRVARRGRTFCEWLTSQNAQHIVVVSHAAFLRCFWNYPDVPMAPKQRLEDCTDRDPIVQLEGDGEWQASMRTSFENCELRSVLLG